jgi:hypothetical protein
MPQLPEGAEMRIAVFAPEGCGNALSKELLRACTGLEAEGASLPFERAGKACRYESCHGMGLWPIPADVRKYDWFLLVTRSPVHSCYSVWRRMGRRGANPNGHWTRGYTDEGIIETIIWQQLAARRMLEMMDLSSVPHAEVTYGDLVNTPRIITSYLPSDIETIPDFQVPEIRNANDNRWKEDEIFVQMWNRYKDIFNA